MADIWIVFLGEYSDRREVAAFDNRDAAITAAEALRQPDSDGRREGVDVDRLPIQSDGSRATFDGGLCVWSDGASYE